MNTTRETLIHTALQALKEHGVIDHYSGPDGPNGDRWFVGRDDGKVAQDMSTHEIQFFLTGANCTLDPVRAS